MSKTKRFKPAALVDPELAAALGEIREFMKQGESLQWQVGRVYNSIVDKQLYLKGGFQHAKDLVKQELSDASQSSLTMYGRVTRVYSEDFSKRYGMSRLDKFMTYQKKSGITSGGGDPGPFKVILPNDDGTTTQKAFSDCTREDLASAIKRLAPSPPSIPAPNAAVVSRMHDTLIQLLGSDTRAAVKVAFSGGKMFLTIAHVELAQMPSVLAALQAAQTAPTMRPMRRREQRSGAARH